MARRFVSVKIAPFKAAATVNAIGAKSGQSASEIIVFSSFADASLLKISGKTLSPCKLLSLKFVTSTLLSDLQVI